MSVGELKAALDAIDEVLELLDVRTPDERAIAAIPGAVLLNEQEAARIESLPRDTKLVLHCHHGGRSQQAAEQFISLGFSQVFNVIGGIDAWSQEIDPDVPRY
jgi:monothiol glutaredoxin